MAKKKQTEASPGFTKAAASEADLDLLPGPTKQTVATKEPPAKETKTAVEDTPLSKDDKAKDSDKAAEGDESSPFDILETPKEKPPVEENKPNNKDDWARLKAERDELEARLKEREERLAALEPLEGIQQKFEEAQAERDNLLAQNTDMSQRMMVLDTVNHPEFKAKYDVNSRLDKARKLLEAVDLPQTFADELFEAKDAEIYEVIGRYEKMAEEKGIHAADALLSDIRSGILSAQQLQAERSAALKDIEKTREMMEGEMASRRADQEAMIEKNAKAKVHLTLQERLQLHTTEGSSASTPYWRANGEKIRNQRDAAVSTVHRKFVNGDFQPHEHVDHALVYHAEAPLLRDLVGRQAAKIEALEAALGNSASPSRVTSGSGSGGDKKPQTKDPKFDW